MYKKGRKKIKRKKPLKRENKSTGILPVLFVVALIALFSETMRTIPVAAYSYNFFNISYKVPKLNAEVFEKKFLNLTFLGEIVIDGYIIRANFQKNETK